MFDLSLAEIAFIAVVTLVVIGPKELPVMMKALGRWLGKFRRFSHGIMQQLELESLEQDIRTIRNDAGEVYEAYDLSDIKDTSRKTDEKS